MVHLPYIRRIVCRILTSIAVVPFCQRYHGIKSPQAIIGWHGISIWLGIGRALLRTVYTLPPSLARKEVVAMLASPLLQLERSKAAKRRPHIFARPRARPGPLLCHS